MNDAIQIRRQAEMLTDKETAQALGLPLWRIRRAVCLGVIPFNRIGTGEFVIHQSDFWKCTNETGIPQTRGDWFDDQQTFDIRFFGHYVEHGSGDPFEAFQASFLRSQLSVGEAMLIHAAQGHASYQLKSQNRNYDFKGKPTSLAGFYSIGPDKFRAFVRDTEKRLSELSFRLHGKSFSLSTVCRHGFGSMVKQCIKRAF